MINNTQYLKQSNNFKTFKISENRFVEMQELQRNFFKYSTANTLCLGNQDWITPKTKSRKCKEMWRNIVGRFDNYWFGNLFTSIKSLEAIKNGRYLLNFVPVEILFDSNKSQLEGMVLDCKDISSCNCKKFEKKYKNLEKRFEEQGKKIKVLRYVKYQSVPHVKNVVLKVFIKTNNIWLHGENEIELYDKRYEDIFMNRFCYPYCNGLTIDPYSTFHRNQSDNSNNSNNSNNSGDEISIETLRLIDFDDVRFLCSICSVVNDEKVIEILNLDKTLKNLTICFNRHEYMGNICPRWDLSSVDIIENILKKKNYHNLEKFNLLFDSSCACVSWPSVRAMLKNNIELIKNGFKQFTIGQRWDRSTNTMFSHDIYYYVINFTKETDVAQIEHFLEMTQNEQSQDENMKLKKLYWNLYNQWFL